MRTHLFKMIAIALLSGVTAFAGSFTSDFSNPAQAGINLMGGTTATGLEYPVIENGHLVLTFAEGSLQSGVVFDDLDNGNAIEGFTAKFKLQIGPGSGNPADGVSFAFGPDIFPGSTYSEEGPGTGLVVIFDTYDNGGNEAPAIDIKVEGAIVDHKGFTKAELVNNKFVDVEIEVKRNGTLTMVYDGKVVYTNLTLTGWAPKAGLFAFGARTGGENANQWIDDLNITTIPVTTGIAPSITQQPASQSVKDRVLRNLSRSPFRLVMTAAPR